MRMRKDRKMIENRRRRKRTSSFFSGTEIILTNHILGAVPSISILPCHRFRCVTCDSKTVKSTCMHICHDYSAAWKQTLPSSIFPHMPSQTYVSKEKQWYLELQLLELTDLISSLFFALLCRHNHFLPTKTSSFQPFPCSEDDEYLLITLWFDGFHPFCSYVQIKSKNCLNLMIKMDRLYVIFVLLIPRPSTDLPSP